MKIKCALKSAWKTLKRPWILPFTGGFNTVFGYLNQYKIVVPLFGAAYAAPNKGTTILFKFSKTNAVYSISEVLISIFHKFSVLSNENRRNVL